MKIVGIQGMSAEDLNHELARGGRFVYYQFCISIVFMTFKRSSSIYFIKGGHGKVGKGLPFTLISLFLGWWGIPWGPIWTISTMVTNFGGGKDVTQAVISSLNTSAPKPPSAPRPLPTERTKQTL